MQRVPDGLPKLWPLMVVVPVPQFPLSAGLVGIERDPASVGKPIAGVLADAFDFLKQWQYAPIGVVEDPGEHLQVAAYSSASTSVWAVWMNQSFFVLIVFAPAETASRFLIHLSERFKQHIAVVGFGSFSIESDQIPACAAKFRAALEETLNVESPEPAAVHAAAAHAVHSIEEGVRIKAGRAAAAEAVRDGRHWAAARLLGWMGPHLTPEERAVYESEKASVAAEPQMLNREDQSEVEWIRATADLVVQHQLRLHRTAATRNQSPADMKAWQAAADDYHRALELMYSPELTARMNQMRSPDAKTVDWALTFLEADPWCFRSGYLKEVLLRRLYRVKFSSDQLTRLHGVLLNAVDIGDRREFRLSCRLARRVSSDSFVSELLDRVEHSPEAGIRRRALWMLEFSGRDTRPTQNAVERVLLEAAADREWLRVSRWVRPLALRYADQAFIGVLLREAMGSDDAASVPALRLLSEMSDRVQPNLDVKRGLRAAILNGLTPGRPDIGIEGLAVIADTPELRQDLERIKADAEPYSETQLRSHWALNAMRRSTGR